MKTTVLVFHPHIENSRVNKRLAAEAEKQNDVEVRYLYNLYPDFKINVAAEQKGLEEADRIVLQFPMYWYSSPALLKQWEDDVLTYGWAYGTSATALHSKEVLIAVSPGAQPERYTREGLYKYSVHELLRPFQTTAGLTGLTYLKPFVTVGAMGMDEATIEERALDYGKYITSPQTALGDFE